MNKTIAPKPITFSVSVREGNDSSGRWLYSGAESAESAARHAIDRCTDRGYAIGESIVRVWHGEHFTPVNAELAGEYKVATKHGRIVAFASIMAEAACEIFL